MITEVSGALPDNDVISSVETLLAQAKSGTLQTLFYVTICSTGSSSHGWAGLSTYEASKAVGEMFFAMTQLNQSVNGISVSDINI